MMILECEVGNCRHHASHQLGIDSHSYAICRQHRDEARAILRKYARELFEARLSIFERLGNDIFSIGEEEQ